MKNILFVTSGLTNGGATKRLLSIRNILLEDKHRVFIIARKNSLKKFPFVFSKDCNLFSFLFFLRQTIKDNKIDAVVCNSRNLFFHCLILNFLMKVEYINLIQIIFKSAPKPFKFLYANKIIAVSEGVKEYLESKQGISPEKITVIRNASPDLKKISEQKIINVKKELKIENSYIIGCVARFDPVKGQQFLIEAFSDILKANINMKLVLMGYGTYKSTLINIAKSEGILDDIVFLDPNYPIHVFFNIVDFFVLPSLREGLPTAILEGFSVGKTVVATNIPGTNEIVKNNFTGLLVDTKNSIDLKEKIIYLYNNPQLKIEFEKNVVETYNNNFSFDKYKESIKKYFK